MLTNQALTGRVLLHSKTYVMILCVQVQQQESCQHFILAGPATKAAPHFGSNSARLALSLCIWRPKVVTADG